MRRIFDNVISVFVILIILLLIVPLPAWALDVFILINIMISLMILLVTMYIKESLEFSIFPSLLLVTTLFRLALNVSSTKLILGGGGEAGAVIKTFGEFVLQGNAAVGFIIFLIILIIQFLVITKGAERVAEVSARFTLDAMPGKQMAIDADLSSGLINEEQARTRREKITREAEFYGSMDGATKFVKGDAIVSLIVSIINLVGGIVVGLVGGGDFTYVLSTYTIATVGDGLVSQIPALLISTATGMVVTRSASENSLSKDVLGQFSRMPISMVISGSSMLLLMLIPGFPKLALLVLGGGMLALGILQMRSQNVVPALQPVLPQDELSQFNEMESYRDPANIYPLLTVELLEMEFGYSLIPIVEESQGSSFVDRLVNFRKKFGMDMGVVIPGVVLLDNIRLSPSTYKIKIKGEEVASGEVLPGYYLIMDSGGAFGSIDGIDTVEPAFGLPGKWVTADNIEKAESFGYSVIEPQSVIITHLSEVIKKHVHELIGRSEMDQLVENVKRTNKLLVDDFLALVPSHMPILQKVVKSLLKEGIPVRDMGTIMETIMEYSGSTGGDVDLLTEYTRQALSRTITRKYSEDGILRVLTLDREVENRIMASLGKNTQSAHLDLDYNIIQNIVTSLLENIKKLEDVGAPHIIMTSSGVRIYFKRFIDQFVPDLIVISYSEIDSKTQIQSFGVVRA